MSDNRHGPLEASEVLYLWPDDAPGAPEPAPVETIVERGTNGAKPDRAIMGIARPRLTVARPAVPNGTAVIAIPGGGYHRLAIDKEAFEMTPTLLASGYTVFTLLYRLPGEGWARRADAPLADAQRAIRLIRACAGNFGIKSDRIVVLGFSAGAHVGGMLATLFDRDAYDAIDDADALNARPDYAALIYPVQEMAAPFAHEESRTLLLGPDPSPEIEARYTIARNITDRMPPCFLVHAEDDQLVLVDNTLLLRQALKAKNVPVETHLYVRGGHGFGLCEVPAPSVSWHHRFLGWMADQDLS